MASKKTGQSNPKMAIVTKYRPPSPKPTSVARQIAHFLDWAAQNAPGEFWLPKEILKAINDLSHMPRANTPEVENVRLATQRAKTILLQEYKRGLSNSRGLGSRAAVDASDTVLSTVSANARRMISSKKALDTVTAAVQKQIDEDGAVLTEKAEVYFRQVTEASNRLAPSHIRKLLLPKPEEQA